MTKPNFTGVYPIAEAALEKSKKTRDLQRFKNLVPAMIEAIEAGEIMNTVMNDVKYAVNYFVDAAYEVKVDEVYRWGGLWENLPAELQHFDHSPSDLRGVSAFIKKLNKVSAEAKKHPYVQDSLALSNELMNLVDTMAYLKSITVKASEKRAAAKAVKEEEEKATEKKYLDHKDVQKVIELLKGKAAEVEAGIYKSQKSYLEKVVARFQKDCEEQGTSDYVEMYKHDPFTKMIIQGLVTRVHDNTYSRIRKPAVFVLDKDWKKKVDASAKRTAAEIVDGFVYKNAGKLSYIIFTKNNMVDVVLKNVNLGRGAVEATLDLTFADGSSFSAESSVVFAVSKLGTPFYRYPTIFRFVKLPGGVKMSQPSEEKMNEEFVAAK